MAKPRLTMRAVDMWVRALFFGILLVFEFSHFDGESCPTHMPLTPTVSPPRSVALDT